MLGVNLAADAPSDLALGCAVRLARSGRVLRMVDSSGAQSSTEPNAALVRLTAHAHRLWAILRTEPINITRLARREGMLPAYLTRVLRLAFLSPAVTSAILAGKQ